MGIKRGKEMLLDNIDILIKVCKKLQSANDDILSSIRSLSKNATAKEAAYLHYLLNSVGDINCAIGDIHDVIDDEHKKIEDDLR